MPLLLLLAERAARVGARSPDRREVAVADDEVGIVEVRHTAGPVGVIDEPRVRTPDLAVACVEDEIPVSLLGQLRARQGGGYTARMFP